MERLSAHLEPFRHLEPAGWFAFGHGWPPWLLWLLVAAGLAACSAGGRDRLFRLVAAPMAFLVGVLVTPEVARIAGSVMPRLTPRLVGYGLPVLLGLIGAVSPPALCFLAFGIGGGALGGAMVERSDFYAGALPGFVLAGALGAVLSRFVATAVAACSGAVLGVGGLLELARGKAAGRFLAANPRAVATLAALIALLGAALQIATYRSEGDRARRRAEALDRKARAREDEERAARFAGYGKRGGRVD